MRNFFQHSRERRQVFPCSFTRRKLLSRSFLPVVLLVIAAGCSSSTGTERQVNQCRDVVAFWSAPNSGVSHDIDQDEQSLTVNIYMKIKSALGEQQGSGSCRYTLTDNGQFAVRPSQIVVGKTVLTSDKDISDALSMNKNFDLPEHSH